ncbi:dynamin family protein-like protein [Lepidopterella palustris CBS 459.81]|uniref:Dynamin family protein-like protein n=1 Tax=Lepidopterella palustris CBS 459.81 TaxID=1314670 RepID=A0A8E2E9F5_9PEZI|nr:dynamin family protein-like protein [Lepidopterella palustris CBS 459.81]
MGKLEPGVNVQNSWDTPTMIPEVNSSIESNGNANKELRNTDSLEGLQTDEQRLVLDTVAQIRKCGLDSILSLPQLVVCGDQSAGKSSVLEALTEIPFPRNDNLCTRFATEIILRRANVDALTIKVIPDAERTAKEKEEIQRFKETITDFQDLPAIMDKAMVAMGVGVQLSDKAFAKDVLSVEIEGPSRPQLTLVDLPGLIQNATHGVTDEDVKLVESITEHYISQPRTICLAVIAAANDYANQGIIRRVRAVDPNGERTLGIITKPDRVEDGSGSEQAFIALARNEDIAFNLGWHVLRNRNFNEKDWTFMERNAKEREFFRKSNFKVLDKDNVGIDALRTRLSLLLFEHVQNELPKLRADLDEALVDAKTQLDNMGNKRTKSEDCRDFLVKLSLNFHTICKAAIDGHYEGPYFNSKTSESFSASSADAVRRLRAMVQMMNESFSEYFRTNGHRYWIEMKDDTEDKNKPQKDTPQKPSSTSDPWASSSQFLAPKTLTYPAAIQWVKDALIRSRGRELSGNFNPLLIGELFWEQASNWDQLALRHMDSIFDICLRFFNTLLQEKSPKDIHTRLSTSIIHDALKSRYEAAVNELQHLLEDLQGYPINYNPYYVDSMRRTQRDRESDMLKKNIRAATPEEVENVGKGYIGDGDEAVMKYARAMGEEDMETHSCEGILHCVMAIYKVFQETFIANVTQQVIERHMVRGLEDIFSPIVVNALSDAEVEAIASEPPAAKRNRTFLEDRLEKLTEGQRILRHVMRGGVV